MPIEFRSEKITFSLKRSSAVTNWIITVARKEKRTVGDIHYIFCSDAFLLKLNKDYLSHDTLTDIITFDYSEGPPSSKLRRVKKKISGEIYISIPRVKENAKKFGVSFEDELHRVMIHGVLHLCGYGDKSAKAKKEMREKEEKYLGLR
jgi:probable rRNA maturation factor